MLLGKLLFLLGPGLLLGTMNSDRQGETSLLSSGWLQGEYVRIEGMITTYIQDGHYYWEIPDSIRGRDLLLTTTILEGAARENPPEGVYYGFAGDVFGPLILRMEEEGGRIQVLHVLSEALPPPDSCQITRLLRAQKQVMVIKEFDIQARREKSSLIEVTSWLKERLFSLTPYAFELRIGSPDQSRSFITEVKGGKEYVIIRSLQSYFPAVPLKNGQREKQNTLWKIGCCLRLLPRQTAAIRLANPRVGYFTQPIRDYNDQSSRLLLMARRWRLEPRSEDREKYLRGELVEPVKPIVFYLDPQVPASLASCFIESVNVWQKVFEKAGFKNAIQGRPCPTAEEDPDFSIDHSGYPVISFHTSPIENAYGHPLVDPRTGEIVCCHVSIFHSAFNLARKWSFAQIGAIDERARRNVIPDSLLRQVTKMIVTHEIGHTLGLTHNFIASNSVRVEQLRDENSLRQYSSSASVMDYTRLNYVIQPQDRIPADLYVHGTGVYDDFAIEWGYRWLPEQDFRKEKKYRDCWVKEKQQDRRLRFADTDALDPRALAEDMGDDPVKAGRLGMRNLQRLMQREELWERKEPENRDFQVKHFQGVWQQYGDYLAQVQVCVGGRYRYAEEYTETGKLFEALLRLQQQEALDFLKQYAFNPPEWLLSYGSEFLGKRRVELEQDLWMPVMEHCVDRMKSVCLFETIEGNYSLEEYLQDIHEILFQEFREGTPLSALRSAQQYRYVKELMTELQQDNGLKAVARVNIWKELKDIGGKAERYKHKIGDPASRRCVDALLELMSSLKSKDE